MKISIRAPATTANLGAGFDCAAVALDLWNEVVVSDGGTPDRTHLGVQAFERIDPADGLRFDPPTFGAPPLRIPRDSPRHLLP